MSKGTRINFYNVGIFKNEIKTNISFSDFIEELNDIGWDNKVIKIKDNYSVMFPIYIEDRQISKVTMGKYRTDYKPFIGDMDNDEYRELEEEIVELATFVYLRNERTMILQHNTNGLRRGTIEDYFNNFLPEEYYIKLTSILKSQDIELIYETTQITSLSIGLNLDIYNQMQLREQQEDIELMGKELIDFLGSVSDRSKELEADETILEYKVDYKKEATLNIDVITRLLDDFDYENESISKFVFNYRNMERDVMEEMDIKKETIDLKGRILPNTENPGPEFIGDTIIQELDQYLKTINENLEIYNQDIDFDLFRVPKLIIE